MLSSLPLFLIIFIIYNAIVFLFPGLLNSTLLSIPLFSKVTWSFTTPDLLLAISLIVLYIEIFKASRPSGSSILDHIFSLLVFIAFLVEFIAFPQAGNSTFFLITLMTFIDVVAGFTVTISTARRDISLDRQL
jgi:hypothetical protein